MACSRIVWVRRMVGIAAVLAVLTTASSARAQNAAEIHANLQHSTAFIVTLKGDTFGYGSGWVLDATKRYLVTNVHVVGKFDKVNVAFGLYNEKGALRTHSGWYKDANYIPGKVVYRDSKRDLALLQIDSLPSSAKALARVLAPKSMAAGQKVYSIGNQGMANKAIDQGFLWNRRTGAIKKSFFWQTTLKGLDQMLESRFVMTDSGVKPGDSGGPVVNAEGKLVGVVSCSDDTGDYAVDLEEVKTFVARSTGKPPKATHAAVGTWTMTWMSKDKNLYAGMTLQNDGTAYWEGGKLFNGTFTYDIKATKLTLTITDSGVSGVQALTWTDNNRFTFTIQYKEGPITFTATRR